MCPGTLLPLVLNDGHELGSKPFAAFHNVGTQIRSRFLQQFAQCRQTRNAARVIEWTLVPEALNRRLGASFRQVVKTGANFQNGKNLIENGQCLFPHGRPTAVGNTQLLEAAE